MTDLITAEELQKLLDRLHRVAAFPPSLVGDLARTVIALHQQLADAKAAQALVAELRAERDKWRGIASDNGRGAMDNLAAITAIEADRDGLATAKADPKHQGMRPETISEHIARDMREGRFPEQSERQMVAVQASLPHEIKVWRSADTLDHIGTWATTRYPEEAVSYVSEAGVSEIISQHGEAARRNFLHLMDVEADRDRLAAANAALQKQVEALRVITTHGADTIATVLIMDIAAALKGRDRVVLTNTETSLGPRILEFAAALAAMQPAEGEQG